jgi:nitroreductase
MEFAEVVRRRRMVRHFADEPVARPVLERIAAAAQRTPSAGFSQGQRLVVVTDPARRRAVAEAVEEEEYVAAGFDPWLSRCAAQFIPCVSEQVYHDRYREPDKLDDAGDEIEWPTPYWWMDVGCTVMMVLLAAVDEGLAAGFAGAHDIDRLRASAGIPADYHPVGVIPVGRPLPDRRSPSLRRGWRPLDEFVRWDDWSSSGR